MEKEGYEAQIKALKEEIELLKKKQTYEIKRQKYGLNWIDVPEAFEKDSENKIPVLEEVKDKSIKNDDGKPTHILIEGDNYHALQCLNYTHKGKIDVIYIDPPYNTGSDGFIYKDARFLEEYPDGTEIPKDHPLRHSVWLSFMYKRLKIAKQLLSKDGIIFISIDDNEQANLKLLCDEIWGHNHFIGQFIWQKKTQPSFLSKEVANITEYILCYKNCDKQRPLKGGFIDINRDGELVNIGNPICERILYKDSVEIERGEFSGLLKKGIYGNGVLQIELLDDVEVKNGKPFSDIHIKGRISRSQTTLDSDIQNGAKIFIRNTITMRPTINLNRKEASIKPPISLFSKKLNESIPTNTDASSEMKNLFSGINIMNYPKPTGLIKYLIDSTTFNKMDAIILDFFAGSGTTLNSVINLNHEDQGKRQCILVQKAEPTFDIKNQTEVAKKESEAAYSSGYKYISDITYERNRRVMQGYTNSKGEQVPGLGNSLKYYKTAFIGQNNCKNANDDDRTELAKKAGCLLSLGENTLDEICSTEYYQLFTGSKEATAVYFTDDYEKFDEFKEKVAELAPKFKKTFVYIFAWSSADDFAYEFEGIPNIQIKAIPLPILEIYKSIYN